MPSFLHYLDRSRMRHLLPTERPTDTSQSMAVGLTGRGLIHYSQKKPERLNPNKGKYFLTPLRMKVSRIHPSLWHFPSAGLISNTPAFTDLNSLVKHPK